MITLRLWLETLDIDFCKSFLAAEDVGEYEY